MRAYRTILNVSVMGGILLLAACSHSAQATSGKNFVATFPEPVASGEDFEAKLRAAANVEPLLRFPARIGVARIGRNGCRPVLLPSSADEGSAWLELSNDLGPDYGEFVA